MSSTSTSLGGTSFTALLGRPAGTATTGVPALSGLDLAALLRIVSLAFLLLPEVRGHDVRSGVTPYGTVSYAHVLVNGTSAIPDDALILALVPGSVNGYFRAVAGSVCVAVNASFPVLVYCSNSESCLMFDGSVGCLRRLLGLAFFTKLLGSIRNSIPAGGRSSAWPKALLGFSFDHIGSAPSASGPSTKAFAIAVAMSSPWVIASRPSSLNFPSMAMLASSFEPMGCMVRSCIAGR